MGLLRLLLSMPKHFHLSLVSEKQSGTKHLTKNMLPTLLTGETKTIFRRIIMIDFIETVIVLVAASVVAAVLWALFLVWPVMLLIGAAHSNNASVPAFGFWTVLPLVFAAVMVVSVGTAESK
jgi:hypothetical protein